MFSIIVPVFNGASKVGNTIKSVLVQEPGLYELLVIDGGSTDGTIDQLQTYGSQLRWLSESDAGVYDAMNKGIGMAGGTYLYFLGAGDKLRPGILAEMARAISSWPSGLNMFYGNVSSPHSKVAIASGAFSKFKLCSKNICHQAIFYERRLFERFGRYEFAYKTSADWVFNMRCFADSAVHKIYLPIVVADFEGNGISEQTNDVTFLADWQHLKRRYLGLFAVSCEQTKSKAFRCWRLRKYVFHPRLAFDRLLGRRSS